MTPPKGQFGNGAPPTDARDGVAIVGMACTFPGARNLKEFWHNIVSGIDAISDVPPQRWDPDVYHDPHGRAGIYCKRGGYIGTSFTFNPLKCSTMPIAVEGAEPEQFLVLRAVYEALQDAGYIDGGALLGERTAVILGRGNYLGAGVTGLVQRGMITEQTIQVLRSLHPEFTPADLEAIRGELQSSLPSFGPDAAPGLIPNLVGGRVANRLDLNGPAYTVDAACASSLIATENAVRGLLSGQFDAVLAGGIHLFADVSFLHVFCAMGALSRGSTIRPFDAECDGTIPGEGVGILLLKRLADAERHGDRIYAVIKGVGTSSDGKATSLTAPRIEGEVLAIRRAYDMAGIEPTTVGLIEAHGTGTPVGDTTELEALREVFGVRPKPGCPSRGLDPSRRPEEAGQPGHGLIALGSIKSMIGHAMPAAGAAAMIKTALAVYHGVLPPSLNCRSPHALLRRQESRFYLNANLRPWINGAAHPRRAGVNAFGFGGVNAHVVLEEYRGSGERRGANKEFRVRGSQLSESADLGNCAAKSGRTGYEMLLHEWDAELIIIEGETRDALLAHVRKLLNYADNATSVPLGDIAFTLNTSISGADHRLAIVASSVADLSAKLEYAAGRLADPSCVRIKDGKGVYYLHESSCRSGKVAFLFPGLGAQYVNQFSDLCIHFPEIRGCFDGVERALLPLLGSPVSSDIFPPSTISHGDAATAELRLARNERANPAVMAADGAMFLLLDRLGIKADMMTGHSSGEWVVLPASGMVGVDEFVSSLSKLAAMWQRLESDNAIPKMVMLAVGTDREKIAKLADEIGHPIELANDNCKHQVVVVVAPETAELVTGQLRSRGIFVDRLPYEHAYHTEKFTFITDALREYFSAIIGAPQSSGCEPRKGNRDSQNNEEHTNSQLSNFQFNASPNQCVLYSSATARPYPPKVGEIVELLANTFARPIRFRDTIEAMYADGAKVFVEVGPRSNLSAFVDDVLRGRPHVAIAANHHAKSDIASLCHALAQLAALHVPINLAPLYDRRGPRTLSFDPETDRPKDEALEPGAMQISLCCPKLTLPVPRRTSGNPPGEQPASQNKNRHDESVAFSAQPLPDPESTGSAFPHPLPNPCAQFTNTAAGVGAKVRSSDPAQADQVMMEHFRLMERFLQVNKDVLRTYMDGRGHTDVPGVVEESGITTPTHRPPGRASEPFNPAAAMTFAAETLEYIPGSRVVVVREFDIEQDLYLVDHCFDPFVSEVDADRERLHIVPLTVTLEMMAEVAQLLEPNRRVIRVRNIYAGSWIEIEPGGPRVRIEITAERRNDNEIQVYVRRACGSEAPTDSSAPIAEGTLVFADEFPSSPSPESLNLEGLRPAAHTAVQVYEDRRMFHGPRFRGVASIDAVGEDGLLAKLRVLPTNVDGTSSAHCFRDNPSPQFIFDPFLLDAAGQLVGYWPVEYLNEGFVLFPIRIKELSLFRENLAAGQQCDCRLRITSVTNRQVQADMDVIAPDGSLWMRISGWEDWRFYWEAEFYNFWRFPNKFMVSRPLDLPLAGALDVECRRMAPFGEIGSKMWENLWAHLILSRRELGEYRAIGNGARRTEWLFGRAVAKDAVRAWIRRNYDLSIYPADVEITQGENGKPRAAGYWTKQTGGAPEVSIAHKVAVAVAAAGRDPLGIDMETLTERDEGFETVAFTERERDMIAGLNGHADRNEWLTRAWCAKEAAGKALGVGLCHDPKRLALRKIDPAGGRIVVSRALESEVGARGAHQNNLAVVEASEEFIVQIIRDGDFIIAIAQSERTARAAPES